MNIDVNTKFNPGDRVEFIHTELKDENGVVAKKSKTLYGVVQGINVTVGKAGTFVKYDVGVPCCGGFIPYNISEDSIISKEIPELSAYTDEELMKELGRRLKDSLDDTKISLAKVVECLKEKV